MRELPSGNAIVTCAVTGAIHTPSMSPALPVTPDEIPTACIEASEAGAAVVHLHVPDPETGVPITDLDLFEQVASEVQASTDVIVQPTTVGAPTMSSVELIQVVPRIDPEMCSCNMGSINFGLYPRLQALAAWEPEYLAGTTDLIFQNTFADFEVMLTTMT